MYSCMGLIAALLPFTHPRYLFPLPTPLPVLHFFLPHLPLLITALLPTITFTITNTSSFIFFPFFAFIITTFSLPFTCSLYLHILFFIFLFSHIPRFSSLSLYLHFFLFPYFSFIITAFFLFLYLHISLLSYLLSSLCSFPSSPFPLIHPPLPLPLVHRPSTKTLS